MVGVSGVVGISVVAVTVGTTVGGVEVSFTTSFGCGVVVTVTGGVTDTVVSFGAVTFGMTG